MSIVQLRAITRRIAFCASLVLLMLAKLTTLAAAHASLIGATPADGAVVEHAPPGFELVFNEPVSPLRLQLIRPDGDMVQLEPASVRDQRIAIDAPDDLAEGSHVLTWRVVSADGHPVGGSIIFSIGAPSPAPPSVVEAVDRPVATGLWTTKLLLFAGLFIGVGGAFAVAWLVPDSRAGTMIVGVAILVGLAGTALSAGFQGLDALGASLDRVTDPLIWRAGMATSHGWTVIFALTASVCGGLALLVTHRVVGRALALLALTGGAAALAMSGHASAAAPRWLTAPAVFVHAATIALWVGALVPLASALRMRSVDAATALHGFSRFIPFAVGLLAASGIVLAVIQVEEPSALWDTPYGRLLAAKLALLVLLFLLAAFNRWRLTRPAMLGRHEARAGMVRSIAGETLVVLVILAIAAGWRFTPPPRALAEAAAQPAHLHIHTADIMADVTMTPGRANVPARFTAIVMTGDFGPLDAQEVVFVFSNPNAGIEPFRREATRPGDGSWQVEDVLLPMAGSWTVRLDVLINDFEIVRISDEIAVRP